MNSEHKTPFGHLCVAVTLDIDPDANTAVRGRIDALSYPLEGGGVSVDAVQRGLVETLGILEGLGLPATVFFEARTAQLLADRLDLQALTRDHEIGCHSLRHEDFSGRLSGIPMSKSQMEEILATSRYLLEEIFQRQTKGFRAPYLRQNKTLLGALSGLGFQYDSSIINDCLRPFQVDSGGLLEFTIASLRHGFGKRLTSYLTALFQGRWTAHDYAKAIQSLSQRIRGGVFLLAFHPWELFVDHSGRPLEPRVSKDLIERLKAILRALKDSPAIDFVTLSGYLDCAPLMGRDKGEPVYL